MSPATDVSAKVEILRQQFVRRMQDDSRFLQAFVERSGVEVVAEAEVQSLRKVCHTLCGAAGVFGYPVVANAASRMTTAFAAGERNGVPLGALANALIGKIQIATAHR